MPNFERFLAEYEERFEKEYGFLRPIIKEVVERYLDCGNPRCGFARIHCPDCGEERPLMFSCGTRGFCPSCHAKRLEEWGEWMRGTLFLDVSPRQVAFTIPKMLRLFLRRAQLPSITPRALQPSLTLFVVLIYASSRWLDGITEAKMRPQLAQPKTKFLLIRA